MFDSESHYIHKDEIGQLYCSCHDPDCRLLARYRVDMNVQQAVNLMKAARCKGPDWSLDDARRYVMERL